MTMSNALMDALTLRGLDVEVLDLLGFDGIQRDGKDALVIPFKRNGNIVRRKYRTFGPEKTFWQDKDAIRCAWNEDCLRDDSLISAPLIVTEGELDAAAAIQCGFERTISVPDGAPPINARKSDEDLNDGTKYQWLRDIEGLTKVDRVKEVIIAADGDESGAQLLHDLSLLFGKFRCKFLTYPKAKDPTARGRERLKDLNEVLEDYGHAGVVETVNRAQFIKLDGVYRMSELPPLPPQQVYDIGFDALNEHYKARLGDFVVITGIPGFGKSSFVNDVCCRLVQNHGLTIAWASFEQAPQRDHKRNLRAWFIESPRNMWTQIDKANADAWIDKHHVFLAPDDEDEVTLTWLLDRLAGAVTRYGAKVVVIDPWNEMSHERLPGENETDYTGRAIKTLKRFAKRLQVHLIVVAHPAKLQKEGKFYGIPTLYDISGSANWYNKADLGIVVHRSPKGTMIKTQKSRYHDIIGRPGEVYVEYVQQDRRFREIQVSREDQ